MECEYTRVDKDILAFLKVIYFGSINDPFEAASSRAYRDLNRTIRFNGLPDVEREQLQHSVTELFKVQIPLIVSTVPYSQESYDIWHRTLCSEIRQRYLNAGVAFYYGQAQKWVNMTMKYLYVLGEYSFDGLFQYLHIPVDNYIFRVAEKELSIPSPAVSWSRWDDYDRQYMQYQLALRWKIKDLSPLRWEFRFWMAEARQLKD